jgi:hypothetical protein
MGSAPPNNRATQEQVHGGRWLPTTGFIDYPTHPKRTTHTAFDYAAAPVTCTPVDQPKRTWHLSAPISSSNLATSSALAQTKYHAGAIGRTAAVAGTVSMPIELPAPQGAPRD